MAKPPSDMRYTREHEWVRLDGDIATIGITDHAQEQLGDVVFVESLDAKVQKDRYFPCHVAFHEPGVTTGEPAIKTLHDMTNLVDNIITTLGRFLP